MSDCFMRESTYRQEIYRRDVSIVSEWITDLVVNV